GVIVIIALLSGAIAAHLFIRRVDRLSGDAEDIVLGRRPGPLAYACDGVEFDRLGGRLNRMLERIHALMENMRQVSNDIAHDLRTPLSRLRQRLESTLSGCPDKTALRNAVEQSIADVDSVLSTFGALLRIARIEARERKAGFDSIDLSALFTSMAEAYSPVAEDHGKRLWAEVAPDLSTDGDQALLTQMVSNLVENAIHHTPVGTRIGMRLSRGDTGLVACVEDDGPGIPRDERARVFRRFVRLDSSRNSPGCGLGLALVAAIADLHQITLELRDREPGLAVLMRFQRA